MRTETKDKIFAIISVSALIISLIVLAWSISPYSRSDASSQKNFEETDDYYLKKYVSLSVNKQHFYINETTDDYLFVTVHNYGDENISWDDIGLNINPISYIDQTDKNFACFFEASNGIVHVVYRNGVSRVIENGFPVILAGQRVIFNITIGQMDNNVSGFNYELNSRIITFSIGVHRLADKPD